MKGKWKLIAAIGQLVTGLAAIVAFLVVMNSEENMTHRIVTLVLAIAYIVIGAVRIVDHFKSK